MSDDEIVFAPMMCGVPAVIAEGDDAIDLTPGHAAIVVGAVAFPNMGPAICIGIKRVDGTSSIGTTSLQFAQRLHEQLGDAIAATKAGKFDKPQVAS